MEELKWGVASATGSDTSHCSDVLFPLKGSRNPERCVCVLRSERGSQGSLAWVPKPRPAESNVSISHQLSAGEAHSYPAGPGARLPHPYHQRGTAAGGNQKAEAGTHHRSQSEQFQKKILMKFKEIYYVYIHFFFSPLALDTIGLNTRKATHNVIKN